MRHNHIGDAVAVASARVRNSCNFVPAIGARPDTTKQISTEITGPRHAFCIFQRGGSGLPCDEDRTMTNDQWNDEPADVPRVTEEASILGVILEVGAMEEAIKAGQFEGDDGLLDEIEDDEHK